ncbi:MAG: hypothetical protein P1V35_12975 [Planctomycetota bacterium]|nr:hypothetical protein [Planctomycetota bacterium]
MPDAGSELEKPQATFSGKAWLGACAVLLASGGYLWYALRIFHLDSFYFAFQLHFVLMFVASNLDQLFQPKLNSAWFDVGPTELKLYRRLGVIQFMRLLQAIGWTRLMKDETVFDGTRATLASYEKATRHGENCHLWLFILVLTPMAWAANLGLWQGVLWMGSMNIFFHLFPCMLQRTQRVRLQRCIQRLGSDPAAN